MTSITGLSSSLLQYEIANNRMEAEVPVVTVIQPEIRAESVSVQYNLMKDPPDLVDETVDTEEDATEDTTTNTNIINITDEEYNELLKIIMAEAGGEDLEGKILVGNVIMNRVNSDEFPDDIISIIYQKVNGVYQFSPVADGRINTVEPSEDCYKAVDMILEGYDISEGALYFEACSGDTWHSRNLQLLFKHGGHRFYK